VNIGNIERIVEIERIDEPAPVRETEAVPVPAMPEVLPA
jgi:hypothetical protein